MAHALQLPAGQFVGIAPADLLEAQTYFVQRIVHRRLGRRLRLGAEEATRRCVEVAIDPLERIERLERVLEHRLDAPQEFSPGSAGSALHLALALEQDVAARRLFQPEDHARQRRLSRPGLADDREDLGRIGGERKVGVDDCIDIAARELSAHDEPLGDVGDLEQRGHPATPASSLAISARGGTSALRQHAER